MSQVKRVDKKDLPKNERLAWAMVTAVANKDMARCLLLGTAWNCNLIWDRKDINREEKDYLSSFTAAEGQTWFEHICDMAMEDPVKVREKAERLARNGWRDETEDNSSSSCEETT